MSDGSEVLQEKIEGLFIGEREITAGQARTQVSSAQDKDTTRCLGYHGTMEWRGSYLCDVVTSSISHKCLEREETK